MSCDTYWWLLSFFFFPLPSPSYTHMPSELMRGSCTLTPAFGVTDWLVAPLAARCSATAPLHALCTVCKRLWEGRVWRPALQPYLLKRLMPLSASQSATSGSSFFFRKHFFFCFIPQGGHSSCERYIVKLFVHKPIAAARFSFEHTSLSLLLGLIWWQMMASFASPAQSMKFFLSRWCYCERW